MIDLSLIARLTAACSSSVLGSFLFIFVIELEDVFGRFLEFYC